MRFLTGGVCDARWGSTADGGAWGKCAVVGSGGSLWRSGLGREIDSHDVVLRVNQAPTVGYERHVGRRTHVRMLNNRWSMKYSHDRHSPSAVRAVSLFPVGRQPSNRCTPHRVRRPSHTLWLGCPCSCLKNSALRQTKMWRITAATIMSWVMQLVILLALVTPAAAAGYA